MGAGYAQIATAGAQSATFDIFPPDPFGAAPQIVFLGRASWESLPNGSLRSLMARRYLRDGGIPDADAFIAAQAAAGLVVSGCIYPALSLQLTVNTGPSEDEIGYPILAAGFLEEGGRNYVKFAVDYSASK